MTTVRLLLLLLLLLATNAAWALALLDQSVTAAHCADEWTRVERSVRILLGVIRGSGVEVRREDVLLGVESVRSDDPYVSEEDGVLFVEDVGFRFQDGILVEIRFMDWAPASLPSVP